MTETTEMMDAINRALVTQLRDALEEFHQAWDDNESEPDMMNKLAIADEKAVDALTAANQFLDEVRG